MTLRYLTLSLAGTLTLALSGSSQAALISGTANTGHSHNTGTLESPFFSEATNQSGSPTYNWMPANGLAGSIVSGSASSTTVAGTITINGNSTSGGGFTDGNSVPAGVTLSFPLSFTVASDSGRNLITAGGNTGNGIAIANDGSQLHGGLDAGEILNISAATIGSPMWSGAPTEPGYVFTGGALSGSNLVGFRSNSFGEGTEGATLTAGADSVGFGTSTGTLASNAVANNNIAPGFPAIGLDVASTLATDVGNWHLKGLTIQHGFSYDIAAIPEPGTALVLSIGLIGLVTRANRR